MTVSPSSLAPESSPPAAPLLGLEPEPSPVPDRLPHGLAPVLVALLLVAVALIVGPTIAELGKPGPDELYYLSYAQTVAERGPGAFRDLFRVHVEESRHWLFPSPLRVGYLTVAALWMKADGVAPQSLGHLSLVSLLLSIVVAWRLASSELGAARGLCVAALFAASPLGLGMARRALQDSFATLAALLALAAFLAALDRPASRWRLAGFAAALAFAIVAKETTVLVVPPLLLWLALDRRDGRRTRLLRLSCAMAVALLAAATAWLVAAGSATVLRRVVDIVVETPSTNLYILRFGGGPWYRYVVDFLTLSAGPTLLGLAGLAITLERARRGEAERLLLFLALLAAVLVVEYAFLNKNLRYVMLLELPLRVFAVEALWVLLPARSTVAKVGATAVAVLLLAVVDVRSFRHLFVERGLYDPVSAPILELRGIVPAP